jgi:hypothetical protein
VDCEVAWYGDAAFDIAFLLNHLLLKSLVHPSHGDVLETMAASAWSSYLAERFAGAKDSSKTPLDQNTGELLLLLLLARIDGKSPVEYLVDAQRERVRTFAVKRLRSLPMTAEQVKEDWFRSLRESPVQRGGGGVA